MTIGMLINAPYPSDVRIKKEADTLLRAGHAVHLLCLRKKDQPYEEQYEGINIKRIDAGKNDVALAFWDIIMSATFVHPLFRKAVEPWIQKNGIEALHVHDLPLVGTALSVKRKTSIPVVADFHENYPDALKVWFEWKKNPLARLKNRLFLNPKHWTKHEQTAVEKSTKVIVVVDEMKERIIQQYRAARSKLVLVSNTEDDSFLHQPLDVSVYDARFRDKFIVTYTGNIGPHRGVDTVIEAMKYLRDYKDIVFAVIGSGSAAVMSNLAKLIEVHTLSDQVFLLGRQPFSKFYSYMHFASANVIPHKSNSHTDNTIPHKLFQGMMAGKPMLVSSSAPLKRIVEKANSGLVFDAGNSVDLSEKIKFLYQHKELCSQFGKNGLAATTEGDMNWRVDGQALIDLYNSLKK